MRKKNGLKEKKTEHQVETYFRKGVQKERAWRKEELEARRKDTGVVLGNGLSGSVNCRTGNEQVCDDRRTYSVPGRIKGEGEESFSAAEKMSEG